MNARKTHHTIKKKKDSSTLFSPFLSSSSSFRSEDVSRKSPREEDDAQREKSVLFIGQVEICLMVFKREKREGRRFDWREEIQLGFRVFFWFRVSCVMCFSLLCFRAFVLCCVSRLIKSLYRSNGAWSSSSSSSASSSSSSKRRSLRKKREKRLWTTTFA